MSQTSFMFSNGKSILNPEDRIREYCEIEIYQGYDDKHSITNKITRSDVDAANKLYAMIDRYDKDESKRILEYSPDLESIPNLDLENISDPEWKILKNKIKQIFYKFISIKGIGLAKAAKLLHLKRPGLFPILDSFVIKFLAGVDINSFEWPLEKTEIGIRALEIARKDIMNNIKILSKTQQNIVDLPIPMTNARLYDILCWTEEKWVIRKNRNAPGGTASKSVP